ncbi:MAG: glycosyltransferase family 8 protein [Acidimicrobiia bacterium]
MPDDVNPDDVNPDDVNPDDVNPDDVNLVVAADSSYVKQLAVTISGISATAGGRRHVVHLLHDAAERRHLDPVAACASDEVELSWIDVRATARRDSIPAALAYPSFYRLHAERLLPETLDRILYLDIDVIIRRPLAELWELDLGSAMVGAVRDAYRHSMVRALPWRELGLEPSLPYFNSGVLCIPLDRWRVEGIGAQAEDLVVRGVVGPSDQDALNIVLAGRAQPIDPRWNVQTHHLVGDTCPAWETEPRELLEAALADPAIVHFCGGTFNRPWVEPSRNPYRQEWFEWLDRTPWAGWRPRRESAMRRALRRAGRAGRVLTRGG